MCVYLFCVDLCIGRGLVSDWSPVQGGGGGGGGGGGDNSRLKALDVDRIVSCRGYHIL
jgi:hypothetical protein